MIGMVLADLYTAISGIGYLIVRTAGVLEVDKMFVPIVTLGIARRHADRDPALCREARRAVDRGGARGLTRRARP